MQSHPCVVTMRCWWRLWTFLAITRGCALRGRHPTSPACHPASSIEHGSRKAECTQQMDAEKAKEKQEEGVGRKDLKEWSALSKISRWMKWNIIVFWGRVSLCTSGCPVTHSVDQAGLELRDPPVGDYYFQVWDFCLRCMCLTLWSCVTVPT